jgi:adenosylcobinamide-phosphate synthase
MTLVIVSLALLFDLVFGEAKKYHPLVGFGNCVNRIEQRLNLASNSYTSFALGLAALIFLVIPLSLTSHFIGTTLGQYNWIFNVLVVYLAIGFKSLLEHSERVLKCLPKKGLYSLPDNLDQARSEGDLKAARYAVSLMVSRDTELMNEAEITSASIESSLENGCDSTFGVLFWFLLGGAPMVIFYRLTNTLDAMWGYRNQRFEYFGKSAAKLDDLLNYVPARITALFYALCGNTGQALRCWGIQASSLASPNGGPVMTSGAGSLNIQLGGPAYYDGKLLDKPYFGTEVRPHAGDISRANKLLGLTLLTWYAAIVLITVVQLGFGGFSG